MNTSSVTIDLFNHSPGPNFQNFSEWIITDSIISTLDQYNSPFWFFFFYKNKVLQVWDDMSISKQWVITFLVHFCLFLVPLVTSLPATITLERPPSILVPLKVHSPPQGYQLYMTCAVRGFPTPHVTWYLNGNCISSNNSYYITNAYGVCSMYIIRVGPEHSGEYRVLAVNSFGRAECSTKLKVKGMLHVMIFHIWICYYYYEVPS